MLIDSVNNILEANLARECEAMVDVGHSIRPIPTV